MKFRPTPSPQSPDPDASAGGGFVDDSGSDDTALTSQPAAVDPADPGAGAATDKPGSMLEAMFGQKPAAPTEAEAAEAAAAGKTVQQLRDEKGRFAGKAPEQAGQGDPTKPLVKPDASMPEGLTPKAQERFQVLANTNKELTAKVTEYEPIVQSALGLQEVFKTNGVKREQFDQAMEVVGLMNRGDLEGALRVLDEQRAMISLHLGRPLPGADALANHPDLRAEVDNLQLTEARALEIARDRAARQSQQAAQQRQRQEQQHQQQEDQAAQQHEQAVRTGQLAVDKFCKARMADDMDYARIEPMLLAEIQGGLLQGIHPAQWPRIVEKTYGLIKQTANQSRSASSSSSVLRPTGGESLRQAPKSMHEAMWGTPKP